MLSLSLVDDRIFFVSEMKFPYKKIFHTQKKCGEILTTFFEYEMKISFISIVSRLKNMEDLATEDFR